MKKITDEMKNENQRIANEINQMKVIAERNRVEQMEKNREIERLQEEIRKKPPPPPPVIIGGGGGHRGCTIL